MLGWEMGLIKDLWLFILGNLIEFAHNGEIPGPANPEIQCKNRSLRVKG